MGILHYLGLNEPFKGLFKNVSNKKALEYLKSTKDLSYLDLIAILEGNELSEEQCKEDINLEISTEYIIEKEGQKKQIYTTRYERNSKLRKKAIQIHGTVCMACGFDFNRVYGERGKDYIEVHHIVPLSSIEEQIEVNPESDLVVVCANCHRMIHRKKNDILTIEELKSLINS
jgi:predicted HNH restriction endonuclease